MKIEHAALYCRDREKTREFFTEFFGAKAGALYRNSRGFSSYFLSFDDGARLEIMNFPDLAPDTGNGRRCGFIHLALSTGSGENVDSLTEKLRAAGYQVVSGPRVTGDGYYESQITGIEGLVLELTV